MEDEYGEKKKLGYNNDGKGKWQSHYIEFTNFPDIYGGSGASKEEAFREYKVKLRDYIKFLARLERVMYIEDTVDTDCFGQEVD